MLAAGCLFIQDTTVVAGYNPKYNLWSGIGGKIQQNESIQQAAYRETIEELFGVTPSSKIIEECIQTFNFKQPVIRNNYAFIPLAFDLFIHIIYILKAHNYKSPYYIHLPITVSELVHQRRHSENQEISDLKLVDYKDCKSVISQDLLEDCLYYELSR